MGVFDLELARIYNYIYQQTDKNYTIIHALDGYDEISLTGDFKIITNQGEKLLSPFNLGMEQINAEQIEGGASIPEAAKIFSAILAGQGTEAQNNVVIANAAMALQCYSPGKTLEEAIAEARESLLSGKAKNVLTKLLNLK